MAFGIPGILALALAFAGDASADGLSDRIDRVVGQIVKSDQPGVAVLVLKEGVVLHAKGYGLANVENRLPIDRATTFDLASVSKQFTAYALLMLEEEGKLALGDDVRKHVPELPQYDAKRPIRLEDLLRHVSGLPDYLGMGPPFPKRDDEMTNAEIAKLVATKPLAFPTGTKFEYSNTNYTLAALVIERVSGASYATFMRTRILEPLGMTGTYVFDHATQVIPHRAYGYARRDRELQWVHSDLANTGDGGIWSCLDDFVKWDAELREPKLLDAERIDRAMTAGKLDDGREIAYGLGWAVGRDGDEPIAEHSGGWVGFVSHHLRLRDRGLTVVVLANVSDGSIRADRLAHRIADLCRRKDSAGE